VKEIGVGGAFFRSCAKSPHPDLLHFV
jgi:hypothetical protein